MGSIYDINPSELVAKAANELKKEKQVEIPEWAMTVKTGVGQERLPDSLDWWYMRSASVLRKIYVKGPIGVSKLRTYYGKKKNRGLKPEKFYKASGKIIRTILQQLETAGLVVQMEKGVHKGRVVTPKGVSFLDNLARKEEVKNE
jgi:small subunit ribosomal protein S19e